MGYKKKIVSRKRKNLSGGRIHNQRNKNVQQIKRIKLKPEEQNNKEYGENNFDVLQHISSDDSDSEVDHSQPISMIKLLSTFTESQQETLDSEQGEWNNSKVHHDDREVDEAINEEVEGLFCKGVAEVSDDEGDYDESHISCDEETLCLTGSVNHEGKCGDDDVQVNEADPFQLHFERNLGKHGGQQMNNEKVWSSSVQLWDSLGMIKIDSPSIVPIKKNSLLLDQYDNSTLVVAGDKIKHRIPVDLNNYFLKEQLQNNFNNFKKGNCLTDVQGELLSIISQYADLYYPESTIEKWDDIRTIYSIHAINHILKTRRKVMLHNSKVNKKKLQGVNSILYRDQGYTRAKVLLLLPFKNSAFMVIQKMISLLFENVETADVKHRKRFEDDFGPPQTCSEHVNGPEDFRMIFEGNSNEDFKIGITLTKKSLKLYTDFYSSDIILASPLGLRYTVGTKGEKDYDCDFLSSIEILIMDHADIFMMQNWEHILVIMESLNNLPKDIQKHSADVCRIRNWSLDGLSKFYRQTIIFASTVVDHNRASFIKEKNFAGRTQVLNLVKCGSVSEVVVPSELTLYKVNGMDAESRFNYFTKNFFQSLRASDFGSTLLYIPDYCDYVRLVRFIKEDGGFSIATINEYMVGQISKVAKARSLFFDGKRQILLYTERFHFYKRYRIKGVRHVIFYDLPTYPHFFSEICNFMVNGMQNSMLPPLVGKHQISCLYQSCSAALVGVLGAVRAAKIIASSKPIHKCSIGS